LAKPRADITACDHLLATSGGTPYPFCTESVLDEQAGVTDAIVRCRTCGQAYLIEMLDWSGDLFERRRFRTSHLDDDVVEKFMHNRRRGSCDINRVGAEWFAVQSQAQLTDLELTLDVRRAVVLEVRRLPAETDIPMAHWRERLR